MLFEREYGPEMYEAVSADIAARTYYPMSVGYAAVAVCRILQDICVYSELHTTFSDYIEQLAGQFDKEQVASVEEHRFAADQDKTKKSILFRAVRKIYRAARRITGSQYR